ncbi:N-6 DNA methylase [Gelidibacter japonicus]|uniref:N-6 DNA methylase n=1 Tax=Gelidibacter japonicus TaxID=1962232 RepID=UPI003A8EB932
MAEKKAILQILVSLKTVQNLRASNIEKNEALLLYCFLLLLAKEQVVLHHEYLDDLSGVKETINEKIKNVDGNNIKLLYNNYIESIIEKVHLRYLQALLDVFLPLEANFLKENSGQLVDSILSMNFDRFSGSDSMQPEELTEIMNYYLSGNNYKSYFNPFSGLSSLAINLSNKINYFGEELIEQNWLLGQIRILIHNSDLKSKLVIGDSIYNSNSSRFYDFIAFNPPFKLRLDKSRLSSKQKKSKYLEYYDASTFIISENFKKLNKNGKMVFVIPNGFLYSNSRANKALKKYLIENNYLESIIALPQRILRFTGIQVNVVILSKDSLKKEHVKFIDATELVVDKNDKLNIIDTNAIISLIQSDKENHLVRYVSNRTIVQNQFNLAVIRYVHEPLELSAAQQDNLVTLRNVIQPQNPLPSAEKEGIFIKVSDLADKSTTDYSKTFKNLLPRTLRKEARILEKNSILLSLIGHNLKPTIFNVSDKNVYYPSNHIIAFEVNEDIIDIDYLVLELRKDYVIKQIKQRSRGTGMPRISKNDLFQIELVVPSLDEQRQKKYQYQESIIDAQTNKLQALIEEFGIDVADENSFLRHKISGTLKNIRGSFNKLKDIIDNQIFDYLPHVYELKANPKLDATLYDYIHRLDRDIKSVHRAVKSVGVELTLQDIKLETLDFIRFIEGYVKEVENRPNCNFQISIDIDEEAIKESQIKEINFEGDKELLHQVFDNIIENAERHAFSMEKDKNKIIVHLLYDFENLELQLDFTNTGNPLPENYSLEAFTRKGSTSGENAGNGIGGWFMNEVMKLHGGKFGFTDETGPEGGIDDTYATTIELTFPIELKL